MNMKLITSLVVLCLTLSLGSAMAQGNMYTSKGSTGAGSMGKSTWDMNQTTIIVTGKTNGTITIDKMAGKSGDMGRMSKPMTRKFNGDVVVVKNIKDMTENVIMIGKMDGITKKVVLVGKTQYGSGTPGGSAATSGQQGMSGTSMGASGMSGESQQGMYGTSGESQQGMYGTSDESSGMAGTSGNIENKIGALENEKVIVTGDIRCVTVGRMTILGQDSDLKEMMTSETSKMSAAPMETPGMAGTSGESQQGMYGTSGGMGAGAGAMENKKVIATATMRCTMTGKMIVIGKLGDIKKEMMAKKEKLSGYGQIGMQGRQKTSGMQETGMQGATMQENQGMGMQGSMQDGATASKQGTSAASNEELTLVMTGVTICKITGINMVVIGKMGEDMTGSQAGMLAGEEGRSGMMSGQYGYGMQSEMSQNQQMKSWDQMGQSSSGQSGMQSEMSQGQSGQSKDTMAQSSGQQSGMQSNSCSTQKGSGATSQGGNASC